MERIKISFISGLYNCEHYLSKCLNSMLGQSYTDFEIILVNNASKDNTSKIARKYKDNNNIILYETSEKLGAGGSRQKGLEFATGDYICIVDCDDYISYDYLERMCKCAISNNFPDIVITNFQKIEKNGKIKYVRCFNNPKQALVQSVAPWAKMYKREYLQNNNLIFRNIEFGEDIIFSSEVYLTNPTVYLENKGKGYFWTENPLSTSHTELRNFPKGVLNSSKNYFEYMLKKYSNKQNEICYFMTKYYLWYLLQSGRNVNIQKMEEEYNKIFTFVEGVFPLWYKSNFVVKEDKFIIKMAVTGSRWLRRFNLLQIFLKLYTKLPMEKFWPSL